MKKSLYFIRLNDEILDAKLLNQWLESLRKKHDKIALFYPVLDEKDDTSKLHSFTYEQALKSYNEDKNLFISKIIDDYEKIKSEFDFVFVVGLLKFGILGAFELNVHLAKELNAVICACICQENKAMVQDYLSYKLNGQGFYLFDENSNCNDFKELSHYEFTTPNRFNYELIQKAKQDKKIIVLPESDDERILKAAGILLEQEVVDLILLGDEKKIAEDAQKLKLNLHKAHIINPANSPLHAEFASTLYEARKQKGMSEEEAKKLVRDRTYFGTLLVHTNRANAMVSGASTTTAETIRPALQLIKTKEGVKTVSGAFFMCLEDKVLLFADCAVTPNPSPEQIAEIAYTSANTAEAFGIEAKVALLSYSTGSSGSGDSVEAVKQALKIANERYKDLCIDAPLQFDAAFDAKTAKSKMPNSKVAGKATVYIFPDLNAANIAYKAVQRTANAIAVGPILQGLKKPVNDLSRGCLVEDIVNTVILSAIQAKDKK